MTFINSRSSFVVVKVRNKILLRVAYCTWRGVVFCIHFLSLYSAGNCGQRHSFYNVLTK